jgi:hypothetical protein
MRTPSTRAVVLAALAAAGSALLVSACGGSTSHPNAAVKSEVVSVDRLKTISKKSSVPVFWVGPRAHTRIEFTRTTGGNVYVRYLTGTAPAGSRSADFVVVATYPQRNAYNVVTRIARRNDYTITPLADGGAAITEPKNKTNVHLVFPGHNYQIEVYAPTAAEASRLVNEGHVTPLAAT